MIFWKRGLLRSRSHFQLRNSMSVIHFPAGVVSSCFHKNNHSFGSPVSAHGVGVPSTTISETAFATASGFRRSVGPCEARRRWGCISAARNSLRRVFALL